MVRALWLVAAMAAVWPLSAAADAALGGVVSAPALLPVEQAFVMRAERLDGQRVAVQLLPAPGYYLYRERLNFSAVPPLVLSGAVQLPAARIIDDPFMGRTGIYEDFVTVELGLDEVPSTSRWLELEVSAQGCSSAPAVCYPPFKRRLKFLNTRSGSASVMGGGAPDVEAPAALELVATASEAKRQAAVPAAAPPERWSNPTSRWLPSQLADRLARGGGTVYGMLALFFGLGLLLAFTPCVLPMLPVVAAMVVGVSADNPGRGGQWRGTALVLAYVLSLALAWAVAGLAAGAVGSSLQGLLQQPAVLIGTALLLLLLGVVAIGLLKIDQWLVPRHVSSSKWPPLRGVGGAVVMGVLSALVLSPCVSPALVGALLYLAQGGSALRGGAALFAMGLGMGLPLLLLAAGGQRFVPRPGPWLKGVQCFVGLLLATLSLWLLSRVLSAEAILAVLATLCVVFAVWWSGSVRCSATGRLVGMLVLIALSAVLFYAATGRWSASLPGASSVGTVAETRLGDHWSRVRVADTEALRRSVAAAGRPALLFVSADWCTVCHRMERSTFADATVRDLLAEARLLYLDVTRNGASERRLMTELQLFGPPALLFFDDAGRELLWARRVGYVAAAELIDLAESVFGAGSVLAGQVETP